MTPEFRENEANGEKIDRCDICCSIFADEANVLSLDTKEGLLVFCDPCDDRMEDWIGEIA